MALNTLSQFLFNIFIAIAILVTLYTCNFYYLVFLSRQKRKFQKTELVGTPAVTIQLPIYNEKYVATRLINAVCSMDYPKERMEIQVLDDSDDETCGIIEAIVDKYEKDGFTISAFHRVNRSGYKAGALKEGLKLAKGKFFAI